MQISNEKYLNLGIPKFIMTTENVEEYLETIYRFKEKGKRATTTKIAKELKVSSASVSEMIKKLSVKGYLKYEPYRGVILTKKGMTVGKDILRKHRIIQNFLSSIGFPENKVHKEACKLEHVVSSEMENIIESKIEQPKHKKGVLSLVEFKDGQEGIIKSIETCSSTKKRLEDLGLIPETKIRVNKSAPLHGPIEVCFRDSRLVIGRGMAMKIFVKLIK